MGIIFFKGLFRNYYSGDDADGVSDGYDCCCYTGTGGPWIVQLTRTASHNVVGGSKPGRGKVDGWILVSAREDELLHPI
jgi:hypothetical protein